MNHTIGVALSHHLDSLAEVHDSQSAEKQELEKASGL